MITARDIERLMEPYLLEEHRKSDTGRLHLCGVKVSGRAGKPQIQLFMDWEVENITIGACADISRRIQDMLDMQDWIPGDYRLIVSSPGIDWPLTELWQFRKNIGRSIRKNDPKENFEGRLVDVKKNGAILIEVKGEICEYTREQLSGARVVFDLSDRNRVKRKRNEARRR